jgi:hypothetical protein
VTLAFASERLPFLWHPGAATAIADGVAERASAFALLTALAALLASLTVRSVDLPVVNGGVLAWVLVWFLLGYALYAIIYGALGSLASRTEDAQAVAGPVGYTLVAGYWASFLAISADPDGPWARVLSLFPATAPMAMPGRIALGTTAWWEPPVAVLVTLAAIVGLVSLAGRVYQNAVLRTGAKVRLRDAWRAKRDEPRGPRTAVAEKVTTVFASTSRATIWTIVLSVVGALAAASIFTATNDVIWSAVALLLTVAAVRRVLHHR